MLETLTNYQMAFAGGQLAELVEKGGVVVVCLLVLSVLALTIAFTKLFQFLMLGVGRSARIQRVTDLWQAGDRQTAYAIMRGERSPVARVLEHAMAAMLHNDVPSALVREDVERIAGRQLTQLRRFFRALEVIAQVSPLLGLFGTVLGMISAFQAMSAAGAQVNPADLADGIWVALLTTAVGLAVAIPTSMLLAFLESRVDRERAAMEDQATLLFTNGLKPDTSKIAA
ncbi:MotA/TolQ/ExbB proton channel family protein [Rhodobacteraceae bacterium RKSG542]|uniref:MotA/TolQ/ExbB proton channel family protein n=1 Tax=Pseudovibrio flavus TaxID=2529854 RepID=UPI0012BBBB78|nr:MotA/TolQ/ExbB proton channel family protein [Pseudovibrio flavus]MTI15891.1 MotA/TolQ/ExbB proton channel family protein [Pseudovibrio flavus]